MLNIKKFAEICKFRRIFWGETMRQFIELVETVKQHGFATLETTEGYVAGLPEPEKADTKKNLDFFFSLVEKCQPFVFSRSGEIRELPDMVDEDGIFLNKNLDAPFECFSIELLDGALTIPSPEQNVHITIHAMLCFEYAPKRFNYFYMWSGRAKKKRVICSGAMDVLAEAFVQRLNYEKCGVERVREKIRIGSGESRRLHIVKRLIHVRPKSQITETSLSGRSIEWSHRWFVRGHWRKTNGLGKDREGSYCVEGYTWVSEHEKGPDHLPTIKKVRVVNPASQNVSP
jgi:hypothetical protein